MRRSWIKEKICCIKASCRKDLPCAEVGSERKLGASRHFVAKTYLAQKLVHQREDLLHQSVLSQVIVAFDQHFVLFPITAQTVDDLRQIDAPGGFVTRLEILYRREI